MDKPEKDSYKAPFSIRKSEGSDTLSIYDAEGEFLAFSFGDKASFIIGIMNRGSERIDPRKTRYGYETVKGRKGFRIFNQNDDLWDWCQLEATACQAIVFLNDRRPEEANRLLEVEKQALAKVEEEKEEEVVLPPWKKGLSVFSGHRDWNYE